jgi:hypothetical protein
VTRKTQLGLTAAAVLLGLAVTAGWWLMHGHATPPADPPQVQAPDGPPDPHRLGLVREAYQQDLKENGPPGMVEMMQGNGGAPAADLPPLPDPFVIPAGYQPSAPSSSADLPPLPPLPPEKPQPPAPEKSSAPDKPMAPGGPSDLPPLPPLSPDPK